MFAVGIYMIAKKGRNVFHVGMIFDSLSQRGIDFVSDIEVKDSKNALEVSWRLERCSICKITGGERLHLLLCNG